MLLPILPLLASLATTQALPTSSPYNHGRAPTVLQYVLEAIIDLPKWQHYLPDDIDADNDGILSEKEVEKQFKSYMKDIFDQLDQDSDKMVTLEEFGRASMDITGINRIIDIAFQSYPIKRYIGHADRNQDGFIAEDDLLRPENREQIIKEHAIEDCGGECPYEHEYEKGNWTLKNSIPEHVASDYYMRAPLCPESLGEKEADVLCRELGHKAVQSITSVSFDEYKKYTHSGHIILYFYIINCQGSESSLDECTKTKVNDILYMDRCPSRKKLLASVTCAMDYTELGAVHLAGGKDPSSGDLHIGTKAYCRNISPDMATVVCRELGFLRGVPQITRSNFFSSDYSSIPIFKNQFECNGSEEKLQDCQMMHANFDYNTAHNCYGYSNGIICKPDKNPSEKYGDIYGSDSYDSHGFHHWWENVARFFFIADTNGDEKVSIEEIKAKIKDIMGSLFQLLDQTNDGRISVEDFIALNVRLPVVLDLVKKLFEIVGERVEGDVEFNWMNNKISFLKTEHIDENMDGIINFKDFDSLFDASQPEGLVSILARNLDSNQNGIIGYSELQNYLNLIFENLDADNSDAITLDDVYKLMLKNQFTCLQIEGVRTFVEGWSELIETQFGKLLAYFFTEFDLNSDGQIPMEELFNAHVPCDEVGTNDSNRHRCDRLDEFFLSVRYPRVPRIEFGRDRRYEISGRRYETGKSIKEKLFNSACIAMQPSL